MPSSLVWSSEDSSFELEQWHIKAQGIKAKNQHGFDVFFTLSDTLSSVLEFFEFLIEGLPPTLAAFASCIDEVESPPSLDSLTLPLIFLFVVFVYFFDLKTPGSAGSAPAHHIYNPNEDIIWQDHSQLPQKKQKNKNKIKHTKQKEPFSNNIQLDKPTNQNQIFTYYKHKLRQISDNWPQSWKLYKNW